MNIPKFFRFVLVGVIVLLVATISFSQKGVVSHRVRGCDYFLIYVEKSGDYVLAEWYGGYDPEKDDIIYGSFRSYGSKEVNYVGGREGQLYIEDYGLDKDDALERLYEECE